MLYEKAISRDGPLIMAEAWAEAIKHQIQDRFYIEVPLMVLIYEGNTIVTYRPTTIVMNELPSLVAAWTKKSQEYLKLFNDNKTANQWLTKQTKTTDPLRTIVEACDNFIKGYGGLFIAYWSSQWREKYGDIFAKGFFAEAQKVRENDKLHAGTVSLLNGCLEEIANKNMWDSHLLKFITFEELKSGLFEKKQLQRRASGYAYVHRKLIVNDNWRNVLHSIGFTLEDHLIVKSTTIKGMTAYPGIATGPASIVFNEKQLSKVKEGDILIAPMTTPDMMKAMHRAAAFVTDEGGMLCHAAIVAREMKKPCVVGTKSATETFKDGDLVEVDANKGMVKKI